MALQLDNHPCFDAKACKTAGRVHLPVAPRCNMQCNYCNRKYDCVNESRPGVSSVVLSPGQALAYLDRVLEREPRIRVVGIAGPGDPFANPRETMETLRLVRSKYPDMLLCVATNGLNLTPYVEELAELKVSHVTITMNAVDPVVGARMYAWARQGTRVLRKEPMAQALLDAQLEGLRKLKAHGVIVKINTILVAGLNDDHVRQVARTAADEGADILNVIPLYPVRDTAFQHLAAPGAAEVARIRAEAGKLLPQMGHCQRCRADAVGMLGDGTPTEMIALLRACANMPLNPHEDRPYYAAATMEGVLVNQHLGEAESIWVYKAGNRDLELVERRETPPPGGGAERWMQLAERLSDCGVLLVGGIGPNPKEALTRAGLRVIETDGLIEPLVQTLARGETPRLPKRGAHRCGSGCAGTGNGCG